MTEQTLPVVDVPPPCPGYPCPQVRDGHGQDHTHTETHLAGGCGRVHEGGRRGTLDEITCPEWSLTDRRIVVAITGRVTGMWTAVVVQPDAGSGYRVGDEVVVRPEALSQRWTVKPLTGVARGAQA